MSHPVRWSLRTELGVFRRVVLAGFGEGVVATSVLVAVTRDSVVVIMPSLVFPRVPGQLVPGHRMHT